MKLLGVYGGIVEENRDPEKLGRLKIRVPHVFGTSSQIGTDDLPWATPFGLPAGGSKLSGGMSWLPENGDQVMVQFLDGEPEKPIWTWGMQSQPQAKTLPLHKHKEADSGVGKPDRSVLTRYGHAVEWSDKTLLATSSQGYALILQNGATPGKGELQLRTPAGQVLLLDDATEGGFVLINRDLLVQVGEDLAVQSKSTDISALDGPFKVRVKTDKDQDAQLISNKNGDAISSSPGDSFEYVGGGKTSLVGDGLTLLVNSKESGKGSVHLSFKDGQILFGDSAGTVLSMDGQGNMAIQTSNGTHIALESNLVQVSVKDGAHLSLDGKNVMVACESLRLNGNVGFGTQTSNPTHPICLADLLVALFNQHTHTNGNNGSPTGPPIQQMITDSIAGTPVSVSASEAL